MLLSRRRKTHLETAFCELPRRFASGETAADDLNLVIRHWSEPLAKKLGTGQAKAACFTYELSLPDFGRRRDRAARSVHAVARYP